MTEYKIGTISRLFGVPAETLRYYESMGILIPEKDPVTGYRSYSPWEVNDLILCRQLRGYGFPLTDIAQMMHEDDCARLLERYAQREAELIELIQRYQTALSMLSEHRAALGNAQNMIGRFVVEQSPDYLFLAHRHCYELNLSDEVVALSRKWIDAVPVTRLSVEIPRFSAQPEADDPLEYDETVWGLSVRLSNAGICGLHLEYPVKYIPARKCIHTVLETGGKGTFLPDLEKKILSPLREQGYQPIGDIIGQVIAYAYAGEQFIRYCDLWVPIQ